MKSTCKCKKQHSFYYWFENKCCNEFKQYQNDDQQISFIVVIFEKELYAINYLSIQKYANKVWCNMYSILENLNSEEEYKEYLLKFLNNLAFY